MLVKKEILGIHITDATEQEVLDEVFSVIKKSDTKHYIVTPNPEMVVFAHHNAQFKAILNQASIALCDGTGLFLAAKLLGKQIKRRITGTDFIALVCRESKEKPVRMGFLGGGIGVAEKAADCLKKKYPWIIISFAGAEFPENKLPASDILFVAYGHPKQERWIAENIEKLPVKIAMGVGGAFDFISGNVPRAPKFVRSIGLEWFYRLVRQPWRWKRIKTAVIDFPLLVIQATVSRAF